MEGNVTRDGFARRSLLVGLIAIAFALSCTSAAGAAVVTARNSMEPTLIDRINDVRAAHGLRKLRVSSRLTNAATRHVNSMGAVGYFKSALHTPSSSVEWTPYGTWIDWYWPGAGYTSGAAGESRTWGARDLSARAAVKRWMNNARNRANLLTASWRRVGVAAVRVSDPLGYYGGRERVTIVVAEFGRRSGQALPSQRLYSQTSALNTLIPVNPPIHPDSSRMVGPEWIDNRFLGVDWLGPFTNRSKPAIWYATTSTPLVPVQVNFPHCNTRVDWVPIPAGSQIMDTNRGENVASVLVSDGTEWNAYGLTPPGRAPMLYDGIDCSANHRWQTLSMAKVDPWTNKGYGIWGGHGGSRINNAAGALRQYDAGRPAGGDFGHALSIRYWNTCGPAAGHPRYVPPATTGDGTTNTAYCIPMGARVQLDPEVDCDSHTEMAAQEEWMRQMCRTFQTYGAIIVDTGANVEAQQPMSTSFRFPWADECGVWNSTTCGLPDDLAARFRIIDWRYWTGT
jgi:uncharacterized protein YkwD